MRLVGLFVAWLDKGGMGGVGGGWIDGGMCVQEEEQDSWQV